MSFAKSRQEKCCSSQAETWQVKNILMKEFDWQVKCDVFVVSMATWTIEYNLWLACHHVQYSPQIDTNEKSCSFAFGRFRSIAVSQKLVWFHNTVLRLIHTRGFAPGACSRGTLREQSSSVCTNDFMGILHPREQNFHPAKCSTIFNRLNIWEQTPGANWANLKTLPRVYWYFLLRAD